MARAEWVWSVVYVIAVVVVVFMILSYLDNSDLEDRIDELEEEVYRLEDDVYYLEEELWYCQDGVANNVARAEASRLAQMEIDYANYVWDYWETRGQG